MSVSYPDVQSCNLIGAWSEKAVCNKSILLRHHADAASHGGPGTDTPSLRIQPNQI